MSYENIQGRRLPFPIRYLLDLVTYRHLALNLVGADLRSRFRRSYLGILWAVLQPLGFALIIAWIWGSVFNVPSVWDYALYVFSGLIVWEYFSTVMNVSQDSLKSSEGYLKQTRIPFFIFQLRTAVTGMVVAWAGSIGLVVLLIATGRFPEPGIHLFYVPVYFVILFMFMTPLAVIMSILGAQLRDLKYVTILGVQALFFLSPVMLRGDAISASKLAILNKINPLAELIFMFRGPMVDGTVWTQEQVITVLAWITFFWLAALLMAIRAGRQLVFAL
jgi:lipopolysaccharide transport system permease protein